MRPRCGSVPHPCPPCAGRASLDRGCCLLPICGMCGCFGMAGATIAPGAPPLHTNTQPLTSPYTSHCAPPGDHLGTGARRYIIPSRSTPRNGTRGGHGRNRTQPRAPGHGSHYMTLIDDANELIENGLPVYRESPCLNPLLCEQSKGGGR